MLHAKKTSTSATSGQPDSISKIDQKPEQIVGHRIRDARIKAGLTQDQIAVRLRIGQTAVSNWESGGALPDLKNRIGLSALLSIPLLDLLPEMPKLSKKALHDPQAARLVQLFQPLSPRDKLAILLLVEHFSEHREAERDKTPKRR